MNKWLAGCLLILPLLCSGCTCANASTQESEPEVRLELHNGATRTLLFAQSGADSRPSGIPEAPQDIEISFARQYSYHPHVASALQMTKIAAQVGEFVKAMLPGEQAPIEVRIVEWVQAHQQGFFELAMDVDETHDDFLQADERLRALLGVYVKVSYRKYSSEQDPKNTDMPPVVNSEPREHFGLATLVQRSHLNEDDEEIRESLLVFVDPQGANDRLVFAAASLVGRQYAELLFGQKPSADLQPEIEFDPERKLAALLAAQGLAGLHDGFFGFSVTNDLAIIFMHQSGVRLRLER